MIHLAIRIFLDRMLEQEEQVELQEIEIETFIPKLAKRHAARFSGEERPLMIELEFLDEPDPNQRFFRFGTDPRGMVIPLGVRL